MESAQYQTYYGIHLNDHTEIWGGNNYNKILVKSYPDENLSTTGSTDLTDPVDFLYPPLIQNAYSLDGVAEGHITLYNHTGSSATFSDYTVSIKKVAEDGTVTDLASHTESFATSRTVTAGNYYTLPIFVNISKQKVKAMEKLLLRISVTVDSGTLSLSHENDSSTSDIKIKIPYARTG